MARVHTLEELRAEYELVAWVEKQLAAALAVSHGEEADFPYVESGKTAKNRLAKAQRECWARMGRLLEIMPFAEMALEHPSAVEDGE